jgi:hypothetical protein
VWVLGVQGLAVVIDWVGRFAEARKRVLLMELATQRIPRRVYEALVGVELTCLVLSIMT